jgi:tetratricopeptide (TPR) repeat protein
VPPLPFVAPLQYWTNAARALAQQLRGSVHAAPLIAEIEEPAAYPEAEMAFAEFCHRLAIAALRPDVGLVIVLRPSEADPTEYTASLDRLARACVSTRVKLVTFDPRTQPATPERRPVRRFELDLGPERMEAGIEAKLAKPDLPLRERMQLTMALANLRLGQDRHEEAFALDLQALELAHASPEPTDMAIAWYQLGNAHYRLNFLEDAEQAYAESAHRALEADQPGLAGMALVGAGHALFCRSETAPALQAYEAATTLFTRLGLLQHEVFARTWTGQTLVLARRFGEARDAFEAALRRCDTIDPAHAQTIAGSRADILHRMAYLYSLAGRADLERKYRHEAEALGAAQPPCMHP